MTLNGLEQPDLTCWLMDRTDLKSMTIDISENKKIVITPWKVKTVLGVPLGGDPLQLPDQDIMSDALADLAIELDLPPKSDIMASRLIEEIKNRPKDPSMVRYFIMVIVKKMLLPSTGLYIKPKDTWIGSDLQKVARINWLKAVFDALHDSLVLWHKNKTGPRQQTYIRCCVAFLVLLYINNLKVPKDSLTVDRCQTPRIQLYTKQLVEDISQEDRVTDSSGNYVFGNLPMSGILGSCYSHPDYDKEKEPHGDNSGTPFADELVSSVEISFPSMFDTVGPHLSGLQDEHKQRVLDALGEYDRQSKLSADAIAKQIRLVQTCHARVSDHIVSIIRGESRTQPPPGPQPQPASHSQPDSQHGPVASPTSEEAQDHHTHSTPDISPTNSPAPQPCKIITPDASFNAPPQITSTEPHPHLPGELFPTMDKTAIADETQALTPQPDADFQSGRDVGIPLQGIIAITMTFEGTYTNQSHTADGIEGHHDLPDADDEHGIETDISMQGIIQPYAPTIEPALPEFGVPNTILALTAYVQDETAEHNTQDELLTDSQLATKIDQICILEGASHDSTEVNKEADYAARQHASPMKHCVKRAASANATDIAASFKAGSMTEGIFIDAFASLLFKDEMRDSPETFGKKIFIPTSVTGLLNIENVTRVGSKDNFSPRALAEHLSEYLKGVNLSKAEQLLLPIINNDHWTLYIVYLNQGSFDILDSNDYDQIGGKQSQHHYPLAQKVLKRLSDGFQSFMPKVFKKFGNYHREFVKCPKMVPCSNDYAFYVMRYMERYQGNRDKLADDFQPPEPRVLRAQILHQLIFHRFNLAPCIHSAIEDLRPLDDSEGSSH
uniref:Ubiquitin-like protease family profile domain-containing protein n=1 Tax=Oryza meridionalis TaxID=40149 RepID=A0A0E0E319_9ORYZ